MGKTKKIPDFMSDAADYTDTKKLPQWAIEDLKKSGLTDETINLTGCFPILSSDQLKELIGFSSKDGKDILTEAEGAYCIPYYEDDFSKPYRVHKFDPDETACYYRIKLHKPIIAENGDKVKYLSPTAQFASPYHAYYLPGERAKFRKMKGVIYLVEGEKKAMKLAQELKLAHDDTSLVIGFPSVNNWHDWPGWDSLKTSGKTVYIVFDAQDYGIDNESQANPAVQTQATKLWLFLTYQKKAANVKIILWDNTEEFKGIDDYLVAHPEGITNLTEGASDPFDILPILTSADGHIALSDIVASLFLKKAQYTSLYEAHNLQSRYGLNTKTWQMNMVAAIRRKSQAELDNVSAELAKQEKQATKKKKAVAEKIPAGEFLTLQELPNGDFKVNINTAKLVVFLMNCGFRVIKTLDNQLILARRNEYGILSLIDKTFMDVEVKSYIASLSIDEAKKDFLVTWLDTNKTLDCFRVLKTSASAIIPQKRLLDKEQEVYFYFVNCYLKITSGGCEILSYDKLDCAIFDSQVIPIEIPADYQFVCNDDNYERGTIEKFVRYVCCDQNGKVNASMKKRLEYCMAKLVHTHQNEANLRLIIFSDHSGEESISKGRSGKSLLVRLLSAFRPELVMIDGKKFDDSDKFAFQSLTPRTNIVCLDDVSRNFDIESLYSAVSDGLTIERKFRDSFRLSPLDTQIVLTANREIVRDVGDSTQARIIQVEFGHFFNKNRTPFKEFGKMLLAKNADNTYKSPDEYFAFLGYMISLVQRYLADPLTIPEAEFSSACRKEKAVKLLDNRTLANFIEICEQPSPLYKLFGKGLTMATIFESYNDFCNDHWRYSKYKVTNIRIFSQRLRAYFESLPEEYVFLKIDKKTYNITKKPSDDIENE